MGLATEGDNIGVCKAYIKDANGLNNLTLPPLFSKSNRLNPGPIPGFLPILTVVRGASNYTYIHLSASRTCI